jgi:Domain of unknown function (DUF4419)
VLDTAKIIDRSKGAISFRVDDVTPAQNLLPNEPVRTQLVRQCGRPFVAFSHDASFQVVRAPAVHPLVNAVCFAFSEHRPLLLTPDDIWIVIAQGFAQHVNNHAERLRKRFVRHEGKVKVTLNVAAFPSAPEDWAEMIDMWSEEICRHVVADFESLLVCNFTTTTPTIRTASQVVMMDAFRQYFDYVACVICGIPEITVKGTIDDWCAIRDRVAILEKYDLHWWTHRLLPICDGFIETVKGRPAEHFWRHIYSPKEVYGGNVVTGWLADLFPYLNNDTGSPTVRNPILSKSRARIRVEDGIAQKDFPVGLSQAPISLQWERRIETEEVALEIVGGFIGVTQNPETKYLQPEIGWAVTEQDRSDHMFSKLAQFHKKGRPKNWPKGANTDAPTEKSGYGVDLRERRLRRFGRGPSKDVIQITDQLGGGTLFGNSEHPWYVRPLEGHVNYEIAGRKELLKRFIDLPDGRYILYVLFGVQCIALAKPPMGINQNTHTQSKVIDPKQTVVIAKSFKTFFERMLQAKGAYYFDDSSFVPDGSL